MKIMGKKVKEGIKIKSVGLDEKEKRIIKDAVRKINRMRRIENRQSSPYIMKLD